MYLLVDIWEILLKLRVKYFKAFLSLRVVTETNELDTDSAVELLVALECIGKNADRVFHSTNRAGVVLPHAARKHVNTETLFLFRLRQRLSESAEPG